MIAEAFFTGAYVTLLNAQEKAKNPVFAFQQDLMFWVLPVAAVLAGALGYAAVLASAKESNSFRSSMSCTRRKPREAIRAPKRIRLCKTASRSVDWPSSLCLACPCSLLDSGLS